MGQDGADLDDLLSDEAVDHPERFYARLRAADPVYWNQRWNGWILTGYDEVAGGFRNHRALSSDRFAGPFGEELSAVSSGYQQLFGFLSKFFVWKDQPYHTRVRSLVNKAFTPRSVEALRPRVRELVQILTGPLRGAAGADFLAGFAFTLPVIVIGDYLGVPEEGRENLRQWAESLGAVIFVSGRDEDRMRHGEEAMGQLADFLRPVIAARRAHPRDDLLSGLVQAQDRGDFLSEDELIANVILMVFAGHETTMNLLANGVVAFSRFPDQWARLRDDPALAVTATEEILRYDGPIRAMARWAREPVRLRGHEIGPATGCCSSSTRPTATRPGSPILTPSTSPAGRTGTPRSARASTPAWARRWPGSRPRRRSARWPRPSPGSTSPSPPCTMFRTSCRAARRACT